MKSIQVITLILFTLLFASTCSLGQQNRTCGTMAYLQQQKAADPGLEQRMAQIEYQTQQWIQSHANLKNTGVVITIPVVVHVVYNTAGQNISDAQIQSQIDVLNEDFRRLNADTSNTPVDFQGVAADCEIEFCLAQRDPFGIPTTGITRTSTINTSFSQGADDVKFNSTGGKDAWPRDQYLNIWVCNLAGGLLGYAQFPGAGAASTDGIVILYTAFGKDGSAQAPFNKGQTTTHEIGHWLNVKHTWGDDGNLCTGSDNVSDTPNQASSSFGCPAFPQTDTCSPAFPGIMFQNYMDYTDDACMNIFTQGQKTRMVLTLDGFRSSLKTSQGCQLGSCDTLFYASLPSYWINPADAGSFAFNTEDNDGLTPNPVLTGYSTDWMLFYEVVSPGDTNFMLGATSWFDSSGQADNWIEFGPITIPAGGAKLSWQHLIADNGYRDGYRVLITTTGLTINDFTTSGTTLFSVTDNDPQTDGDTIWTSQYTIINGGTFGGQQVYIAFHHNATDMNVLYLDNFLVDNCPIVGIAKETFINNFVSIYPNPSSGAFFLRTDLKIANELIVSVYDILGKIVYSKEYKQAQNNIYKIDLSNNPKGIYFVRISNDDFIVTKKVVFY